MAGDMAPAERLASVAGSSPGSSSALDYRPGRRWVGLFWSALWLAALGPCVAAIVDGRAGPVWLASLALGCFVGLYLAILWLAVERDGHRWGRWVLAGLALVAVLTTIGYGGDFLLMFIFVSTASALLLPVERVFPAIGLAAGVMIGIALAHSEDGGSIVALVFGTVMAGMVTMFVRRLTTTVTELRVAREELARLAVADERLRFARDLHDLLGHTLSVIVLKSEVVRRLVHADPDEAARAAADIEQVGRQALAEVREAVSGYRDRTLAAELDNARDTLAAAGIELTVGIAGRPVPPETDALFARAVREGVTNVLRHSNARRSEIEVRTSIDQAVLEIRDDGGGPGGGRDERGSAAGGTGLRGLAERIGIVGGQVESGPRRGGGFRLVVTVPLDSAPPATPPGTQSPGTEPPGAQAQGAQSRGTRSRGAQPPGAEATTRAAR